MSRIYFTADCHFGHDNIILYTGRPFLKEGDTIDIPTAGIWWKSDEIKKERGKWMNEEIIKRWNDRIRPNDTVYHLGDFSFKGQQNAEYFGSRLNGNIVHIEGNHDYNNGVKTYITVAFMQFGNLEVMAQHVPPSAPGEIPDYIDLVLCGHVHKAWRHAMREGVPIINVGVDVWDYTPVSVNTILKEYHRIMNSE